MILERAKYGMTLNVAINQSKTEPPSSAIIYAPPLLQEITMQGPRYLACIFLFRAFSIAVLQIKTMSPSLKSMSQIV